MFGIDFARPPESFKLKMAWDMLHKLNAGVFGQMIIVPLLQKHRILAQVAGYHTEVIKFLPPLTLRRGCRLVPARLERSAPGDAAFSGFGVGDDLVAGQTS